MSTVLENRQIKATRKPWQCDGCARRFGPGTPKMRQRGIGDDGPYTWETCATCTGIMGDVWARPSAHNDYPEGITGDDIYEEMRHRFDTWEAADAHFAQETPNV